MTSPAVRLWPRSLAGQLVLLVAVALFAAQAINFALLLRERQAGRIAAVSIPAITRIADASDRLDQGRPLPPRARTRQTAALPIPPGLTRVADVEAFVARGLDENGVRHRRVVAALRAVGPRDVLEFGGRYRRRLRSGDQVLMIAVEQPRRGWLSIPVAWPTSGRGLIWRLVAQTLVLYGVVLLPVLWLARRISRPLGGLAAAALAFHPRQLAPPLVEHGPADVRQVIAAFNALRTRVAAMLDEKDRMLGAIGHDLRTPLAALRVRVESVEDDADRARMAETIDEMARTLEDILALARLGRSSEPVTDVDLGALVDAVVDDFRDLGHAVTAPDPERLALRLRPTLMRRAVRNLLENAIKYAGAAEVAVVPTRDGARIEVSDRGPGIPADRLADVFDPFTRLETSRNRDTGGIGLGLALTRAIVEEAGGRITLVNREGGGLRATIELVRAAEQTQPVQTSRVLTP